MDISGRRYHLICVLENHGFIKIPLNLSHAGWILSSFFFGYLITQVPGGWLAERYGGRWIFGIGIVMTAVLTLFTPLAVYWHIGALIAVRVAEGFFEVRENMNSSIFVLFFYDCRE